MRRISGWRLVGFLALTVLLVAVLMAALRDFVREVVVVPLSYLLWFVELILKSIPQFVSWALLLAIVMLLVIRSLRAEPQPAPKPRAVGARSAGTVEAWLRRIRLRARGQYSRERFAQHLGSLVLTVLAYRERLTPRDIQRRLENGDLAIPPEIRAYLEAEMRPALPRRVGLTTRLMRRLGLDAAHTSALDRDLEEVVQFLEDQLEVPHGD